MAVQKTSDSQSNPEPKEQRWWCHNTRLQAVIQSHNNKKQHGIGTQTDTKTNGIEQKTHT
jgi:hypothetical protein